MGDLLGNDIRYTGHVTRYTPERGFGFIKKDGKYYFVHISQIVGGGNLAKGDLVEFSIGFNQKAGKEQAENVLVMENR